MFRFLFFVVVLLVQTAYADFEKVDFSDIQGWQDSEWVGTAQSLRHSCTSLARSKNTGGRVLQIKFTDWKDICSRASGLTDSSMKVFLEDYFQPLRLRKEAFFTGYFEAHLNVSRKKDDKYNVPVLAPPGSTPVATSAKEDSLLWQLQARNAKPLQKLPKNYDRKRIEKEAKNGQFRILFWADSAIDVFLAQIQGSASVTYPDGSKKRISYAGNNGYKYKSIGKYLIESGKLESLPDGWFSIRSYLEANSDEAQQIMWQNPRYIFFQFNPNEKTYGRFKTPLIAGRSAAADDELMPFGTPIWLEMNADDKLNLPPRLFYIHDTGSAIEGLGRTDIFFGSGNHALDVAARLRHSGKFYILVPKAYSKRKRL